MYAAALPVLATWAAEGKRLDAARVRKLGWTPALRVAPVARGLTWDALPMTREERPDSPRALPEQLPALPDPAWDVRRESESEFLDRVYRYVGEMRGLAERFGGRPESAKGDGSHVERLARLLLGESTASIARREKRRGNVRPSDDVRRAASRLAQQLGLTLPRGRSG